MCRSGIAGRAPRAGFEPAAFPLGGGRSIHLSYRGVQGQAYDGRRTTDTKKSSIWRTIETKRSKSTGLVT
jgi:hypothetical protein